MQDMVMFNRHPKRRTQYAAAASRIFQLPTECREMTGHLPERFRKEFTERTKHCQAHPSLSRCLCQTYARWLKKNLSFNSFSTLSCMCDVVFARSWIRLNPCPR